MASYSATFSTGRTINIAKSTRDYGFAWIVAGAWRNGVPLGEHGFARTYELAERAARSVANRYERADVPDMPGKRPGKIDLLEVVPVVRG
jgi:hypothetical protein